VSHTLQFRRIDLTLPSVVYATWISLQDWQIDANARVLFMGVFIKSNQSQ